MKKHSNRIVSQYRKSRSAAFAARLTLGKSLEREVNISMGCAGILSLLNRCDGLKLVTGPRGVENLRALKGF